MKILDLFCGMGGWGDGFAQIGFEVLGIEIEPEIAKMNKHKVIVTDVCDLVGDNFKDFDVIVGSPPCRDFTKFSYAIWKKPNYGNRMWKNPPNPSNGLKNVHAFLRIIKEAQPKIWLMENVPELANYIDLKPRMEKVKLSKNMVRSFWGNFPLFLIPLCQNKKKYVELNRETKFKEIHSISGQRKLLTSVLYAKIPLPTSLTFANACKDYLTSLPLKPKGMSIREVT